jgi:hypothetical protein
LQSKGVGWVITDAMPLVYTVRTCNQAGTYPDDPESIGRMMELLHLGLRGGVEVLDVEAAGGKEAWGGLVEDAKEVRRRAKRVAEWSYSAAGRCVQCRSSCPVPVVVSSADRCVQGRSLYRADQQK